MEDMMNRPKWMSRGFARISLLSLLMLPAVSCTARYQDMIRERDENIQELEASLAGLRNRDRTLANENANLKSQLARYKTMAQEASAKKAKAPQKDPLAAFRKKLGESVGTKDLNVRYVNGRISIGIPNRVTFSSGSKKLSPEGQSLLVRLGRFLRSRFPGKRIYVEGHTDSDPIRKAKGFRSNRHLSAERADAVATFLIKKAKVPESRIVIVGFGPNEPISRTNKALNRRVEIVVAN